MEDHPTSWLVFGTGDSQRFATVVRFLVRINIAVATSCFLFGCCVEEGGAGWEGADNDRFSLHFDTIQSLGATLLTCSSNLQHPLDASFSSNLQHALDATLWTFSSNLQHVLATPVAFPSNLQHAVDVGDGMLLNSDLHGNADQDVDVD